ncbi:MAG: NAD(P)/FAD-dependent oxidoreductase [Actinobacteria bacterium]|nr:NAD(P)/FAD-dependent oxidoreductase [Actinomycetota bacterium]
MDNSSKILIVGSGGNAIAIAAQLQKSGMTDYRIITAHSEFGGAWHINRYPGCGVDTNAFTYQLEIALGTPWTTTHPKQPEILGYFVKVAHDLGLHDKTDFETEMTACSWNTADNAWVVDTTNGQYHCQHLVLATGFLNQRVENTVPGQDLFERRIFHSQQWPDEYTGAGDRIAVVGSGSSALQIVPAVQPDAESLVVFQRTPTWILPKNERVFSEEEQRRLGQDLNWVLEQRAMQYSERRAAVQALNLEPDPAWAEAMQETGLRFLEEQVSDPKLREILTPDHNFGCKRRGLSDNWYSALQKPNVELVPEAAAKITATEITSQSGRSFEVDTIVLCTGFRWGTEILDRVYRRDGQSVAEAQGGHPRSYKGVNVSKCPNLWLLGGPAPNGRSQHEGLRTGELASFYIVNAIERMESLGVPALEVREEAEAEWKRQADEVLSKGAATSGECSNYITDRFGCNMADWPGDDQHQTSQMSAFVEDDYVEPLEGVALTPSDGHLVRED